MRKLPTLPPSFVSTDDATFISGPLVSLAPAPPSPSVQTPVFIPPPILEPPTPPTLRQETPVPIITSHSQAPGLPAAQLRPAPKTRRPVSAPSSRPIVSGSNANHSRAAGSSAGSSTSGIHYLNNPHPPYPAQSRFLRQQGLVIIGVDVSASGRVTHAQVSHSSGFPLLDQAALEAVRHWVFTPARHAGVNIPAHADVPVHFSLSQ